MTFDIFNRHADKIEMANVAQTINCLHSLFAAVGDKYTRTPAYYDVRDVPAAHGRAARAGDDRHPRPHRSAARGSARLPGLSGSASVRDKGLTVTLTNPSLQDAVVTRIRVSGGAGLREGRATVLTHEDMHATNTFEKPNEVGLAALAAPVSGDTATVTIPKQAVVAVSLQLA